jgi:adenylate cyclase
VTAAACCTCGTEPLENARFCHGCGASLSEARSHAEYKQVTVLFADVVHSMEIAAAVGAERLREIMADLVNRSALVVRRYGGTVDKFTGDGIMAVFGAPVALEDHAVRACLAALGIQQQAAQLAAETQSRDRIDFSLRVGLNSGEVIAGEVASPAMGYTAVGEHVGLAQRMESVAAPGGVTLSESTARLVSDTAVLGQAEPVRVKGAGELIARRLLGMQTPHAAVGRGEAPLVGRHWEIAAVEANLGRSIDGDGTVIALVGPAGIGKSRMVREIAATAAGRGAETFWSFCESHTSDIPFHAVGGLLRAVVGLSSLDDEQARDRLRGRFDGADEQDLVLLDDLLGIRDSAVNVPNIDPDARRRRLSALVKSAAIARSSPAVYIVEDVHWIDDASDAMLADFMTVMPQTNSMVLVTHRPEFHGALTRIPGAQTLTLAPLTEAESVTLAAKLLGSDQTVSDLAELISQRAAGNPFFAEEIVRDLVERGVLAGRRGAYVSEADVDEINVPATLQATIAARIDRLNPSAKRTLCAAAVIGMRFDIDFLTLIGVAPVMDEPIAAELIDQVRFTGHPEFAFRHPLIRTVAYESQLRADRAALHRRLAEAIESGEDSGDENAALIAEHLEAAGDLRAAYGWHMRAAETSQSRHIAAAVASWDRAAELADRLPTDQEDRLAMQIAPRTMSCANSFRIGRPIARARYDELQALCAAAGDKASVAVAMMGLVAEHLSDGRLVEASRLAGEMMAMVEAIGDPTLTVGLALGPMAVKVLTGEVGEVLRWSSMVVNLAESDSATGHYIVDAPVASAYAMRSTARWWFGLPGWQEDFARALEMVHDADPISRATVACYTYYNAIGSDVIVADDAALRGIDEALQSAEQASDDLALALLLFTKANALHQDPGQREHGYELLERVRVMTIEGRFYDSMLPVIDARLAEVMGGRGDPAALPILRNKLEELYASGMLGYCTWATDVLVHGLVRAGTETDLRDAAVAVERLSSQAVLDGSVFRDLIVLKSRALLARAHGDEVAYRDLAGRYLDMATSLGFEGHIAMAEAMVGAK